MRWPLPRNQRLAARVPDGGLRRFLSAAPPPPRTPLSEASLLAVDLETTGLDADRDHVISVGMLDVDGLRVPMGSAESFLVLPDAGVGQSAVIHEVTDDELLADGVSTAEALDRVFDRLAGRVLLAHHAAMEVGFLSAAAHRSFGVRVRIPSVDTMALGRRALGEDRDHPPDALRLWRLRARAGLPSYRAHDAVTDALACAEVYLALAQEVGATTLGGVQRG